MNQESSPFIDRERELAEVNDLLLTLKRGDPINFPIREFAGIGGIGKSWLLQQICLKCETISAPFIFIDFAQATIASSLQENWQVSMRELIKDILHQLTVFSQNNETRTSLEGLISDISNSMSASTGLQEAYDPLSLDVIEHLLDLFKFSRFSGTLLFDSLQQVPKEMLEYIGQEIVFPLSDTGRILLVFGTREKIDWGAPKYKIWRRTKSCFLNEFSPEETSAQLAGTSFQNLAKEIHSVTNGHPASNDIVAKILDHIEQVENRKVSRELFGDYEARLVATVVDKVIQQEIVVPDRLFKAFCILSVLRRFDLDVPREFLDRINPAVDWVTTSAPTMNLFHEMINATGYVVRLDVDRNCYAINTFVRKTLSLYLRFFEPNEYLNLSRAALAHYERRLDKSHAVFEIVNDVIEKLYHQADIIRMSQPQTFDLNIAMTLRDQLKQDVIKIFGVPYETIQFKQDVRGSISGIEERRRAFDRLRRALEDDQELNERLGDTKTPSFLVQFLDEMQKELLDTGKAILDIFRNYSVEQSDSLSQSSDAYTIAFMVSQRNVDITLPLEIPVKRKVDLLNDVRFVSSIDELEDIGKAIRNQFLPSRIQDMLREHAGPLVINVNDTEIPWEVMHDGEEFIALKIPLGKRLRIAESVRINRRLGKEGIRPLLVGVQKSKSPDFESLPYVEEEITSLKDSLKEVNGLIFEPTKDVILNNDANGYQFLKRLNSGRYNIVHFAGHAIHDEKKKSGGLVLYDEIVSLETIKNNVEGRPIVFLNACHSAQDETIELRTGYIGSYTLGVSSAFILGGALACVGSIWKVEDSSSAKFAGHFYKELLSSVIIGEALRRTKVTTRNENPEDKTWASYVLFGDPTVRLLPT